MTRNEMILMSFCVIAFIVTFLLLGVWFHQRRSVFEVKSIQWFTLCL